MPGYSVLFDSGTIEVYSPFEEAKIKVTKFKDTDDYSFFGRTAINLNTCEALVSDYHKKTPKFAVFNWKKKQYTGTIYKLPEERAAFAQAVLDGRVYVCGGLRHGDSRTLRTCHTCDPSRVYSEDDPWASLPDMHQRRAFACAAATYDGCVLVCGGQTDNSGSGEEKELNSVELYDPKEREWIKCRSMKHHRSNAAAVAFEKSVIVAGGADYVSTLDDGQMHYPPTTDTCEIYNVKKDEWSPMGKLNHARSGHQLVLINDKVFAIGGKDSAGRSLQSVERLYMGDRESTWEFVEFHTKMPHYNFGALSVERELPSSVVCSIL